jgi:hypothetical protein
MMDAMNTSSAMQETVRQVVRGEAEWSVLEPWGIVLRLASDGIEVENPSGVMTRVDERDIAAGMLRLSFDPIGLQRWAQYLLAASVLVELDLEGSPYGQRLLEELWDLADERSLSLDARAVCNEIITRV